jgi:hypothetical protein
VVTGERAQHLRRPAHRVRDGAGAQKRLILVGRRRTCSTPCPRSSTTPAGRSW